MLPISKFGCTIKLEKKWINFVYIDFCIHFTTTVDIFMTDLLVSLERYWNHGCINHNK